MILARTAIEEKRRTKIVQADQKVDLEATEKTRKTRIRPKESLKKEIGKTEGKISTKISQRRKAETDPDPEERTNPKKDVVDDLIMIMNEK